MSLAHAFSPDHHGDAPPVDLSNPAERERLSPEALRAFFTIMAHWNITDGDARRLLGDMSNGAYHALKRGGCQTLDEGNLVRISFLIGIFRALNIVHSEQLADCWMQLPNTNGIFDGKTPLEYLMQGDGRSEFRTVRRLLDAERAGH